MTIQTIQFDTVSPSEIGSGAITAFLFSGTTLSATLASIAENGTLKGRHTGTVTDIAAGDYRLVVKFDGYTVNEPDETVTLLLAVGTYVSKRLAELDSAVGTQITAIETFATRMTTGLVQDGAVYQFTANMLELAGGGGSSDWTANERTAIRSILGVPTSGTTPTDPTVGVLDTIRDLVVAYIAAALATVNGTSGTIVGFPATLNIGDSYTDDCNSSVHVFIRDENDDPITAVGTHDFTDGDFAPECIITQNSNTGRVKCEVTYVTASPENYLKIQIPSKESRRATVGIATVQVLLKWDNAQKALAKQTVTWEGLI